MQLISHIIKMHTIIISQQFAHDMGYDMTQCIVLRPLVELCSSQKTRLTTDLVPIWRRSHKATSECDHHIKRIRRMSLFIRQHALFRL